MIILKESVLDKGHLALFRSSPEWDGTVPIDRAVAQYARASTSKFADLTSDMGLKTPEEDHKLVRFLLTQDPKHVSPLEHVILTFHIKAPIVVLRQMQRHWSLRWSEASGRYQEYDEDEFYLPTAWRLAPGSRNRQKSGTELHDDSHAITKSVAHEQRTALNVYRNLLVAGIERGQARLVLPLGAMYSEAYFTCNLRDVLLSLIPQRDHEDAFWETREYGRALRTILRRIAPVCYAAAFEKE